MDSSSILSGEEKNRIIKNLDDEYKIIIRNHSVPDIFIPRIQYLIDENYRRTISGEDTSLGLSFLDTGSYKTVFLLDLKGKKYVLKKFFYDERKNDFSIFKQETIALYRGRKVYEKIQGLEKLVYLHDGEQIQITNFVEGEVLSNYRRSERKIDFNDENLERLAYTLAEMYSENIFPLDSNNDNNIIITPKKDIVLLDYHLLDLEFLTKPFYDKKKVLIPEAIISIKQLIRLIGMNDIGIYESSYFENTAFIATRILPYIETYFLKKGYKVNLRPVDIVQE